MADGPSLAVNVSGILQIASKITQISYSHARDVHRAPITQKAYLQGISALMEVLLRTEEAIRDTEATGLLLSRPAYLNDDLLADCHGQLTDLYIELQKHISELRWPLQDKEVREKVDMLRKYRSLFADFLSACVSISSRAVRNNDPALSKELDRPLLLSLVPSSSMHLRQKPSPCKGTGQWFLSSSNFLGWMDRSVRALWCHGPPGVGKSFLASIAINRLLEERASRGFQVIYFFCDVSSRGQQRTLEILHCLLRQLIEHGSPEVITTLKDLCQDPSKLTSVKEVARLIMTASSKHPLYMVLDAPDELEDPTELLQIVLSLAASGIQVMVMSRDLPRIRKIMEPTTHLEIRSNIADLRLYTEYRIQESDIVDRLKQESCLIDGVISKSNNRFLPLSIILDEVLGYTTVSQMHKVLTGPPLGIRQALDVTIRRISAQSESKASLVRLLLAWITYAKRRLRVEEIASAFAVDDNEEPQSDNRPSAYLLLRVCAGLVVIDQVDDTLGLVHASAYEYFRERMFSESDTSLDIAQTSLKYLSMDHLATGPCKSHGELMQRFESLPFLDYSAEYWGHHFIGKKAEATLDRQIMRLLDNRGLRDSAFQALQYQVEFSGGYTGGQLFNSLPQSQDPLHIAVYWGMEHITKILLRRGACVDSADSRGWSPLHWACARSHLIIAKLLVRNGADVNSKDMQGWTPLLWAVYIGNLDIIRFLLAKGANHLIRNTLGWSALHWAIFLGHADVSQELLEHHPKSRFTEPTLCSMSWEDIRSYAESTSPIQVTAAAGDEHLHSLLVTYLRIPNGSDKHAGFNTIWPRDCFDDPVACNIWRTMSKQAAINGPEARIPDFRAEMRLADPRGWQSFLFLLAIRDQQLSSARFLVKAGADTSHGLPLHVAACRKDPRYVRCLLENGANPTAVDLHGRTALHEAVLNGFVDTIDALIEGGADVNQAVGVSSRNRGYLHIRDRFLSQHKCEPTENGATALMQAFGFRSSRRTFDTTCLNITSKIVQLLLSKGADPLLKDSSGRNVLHYAVLQPCPSIIKLLIEAGCLVDVADEAGLTPLHYLATLPKDNHDIRHLRETVSLILGGKKTDLNKDTINQNIDNHINPTEQGNKNHRSAGENIRTPLTPVKLALQNRQWKLTMVFLEYGATFPNDLDPDMLLDQAITALQEDAVDMLLDRGAHVSDNSLVTLVEAYTALSRKEHEETRLYARFEHILMRLVSSGMNVNCIPPDVGGSAFTIATRTCEMEPVLEILLKCGADVYVTSPQTFDPIRSAAVFQSTDYLRRILEHALHHPNEHHWSRFLNEIWHESDPIACLCTCLRRANALDERNEKGQTLLYLAAEHGNSILVDHLLLCGARIDTLDDAGWLPAHHAGFSQKTAAFQRLVPLDTNPDKTDTRNYVSSIINKRNDSEKTIFQVSVECYNVPMVQHLLKHGIDPNTPLKMRFYEVAPLYHSANYGFTEFVHTLLKHGANTESPDYYAWRPLHVACFYGHLDIVRALLDSGADAHAVTQQWNNNERKPTGLYKGSAWAGQPLHLAAMGGYVEICRLLIDRGVDITASTGVEPCDAPIFPGHGPTPLHILLDTDTFYDRPGRALDESRLQIAEWLVAKGAMVRGVIRRYSLEDILNFRKFPGLWNALVAGDA